MMGRRVLLVSRAFFPTNNVGALRAARFAKYLPRFGIEPIVLCADWNERNTGGRAELGMFDPDLVAAGDPCETIRVPFDLHPLKTTSILPTRIVYRYLWRRFNEVLHRDMVAAARELRLRGGFDAVWSTSPEHLIAWIGREISGNAQRPWIADFRDSPLQGRLSWNAFTEMTKLMTAVAPARALVTVTEPLAEGFRRHHRAPVHVIPNGFDPEEFAVEDRLVVRNDRFVITYAGTLYAYRDPSPLFQALDLLAAQGVIDLADVSVRFHGSDPVEVARRASGHVSASVVECTPRMARREVIHNMQQSAVLLMVSTPDYRGVMTGKLLDYLAVRRPILNVPGDADVVDETLRVTGAGHSAADPADIARILAAWYREWKASGTVRYVGVEESVARFSCVEQAGRLASVLADVVGGS